MDWFEELFGFKEDGGFAATKKNFVIERPTARRIVLRSRRNDATFNVGPFECPSLSELRGPSRKRSQATSSSSKLSFRNIVGDARALHLDPHNAGAVFQVASQFNCLEMFNPQFRPEDGVTIYEKDRTQGPACALACPAATVIRNYFALDGKGQAGTKQLNLLRDVGDLLENGKHRYWQMQNGYCLPTSNMSIDDLRLRLVGEDALLESMRSRLRVGVHWSTQVRDGDHQVCQVFCSALPLAYAPDVPAICWEPFARVILEAAYDATLAVAAKISSKTKNARVKVFLTPLGGGSFGNPTDWIAEALEQALDRHREASLDVRMVHFSRTSEAELTSEDKRKLFGDFARLERTASVCGTPNARKRPAANPKPLRQAGQKRRADARSGKGPKAKVLRRPSSMK